MFLTCIYIHILHLFEDAVPTLFTINEQLHRLREIENTSPTKAHVLQSRLLTAHQLTNHDENDSLLTLENEVNYTVPLHMFVPNCLLSIVVCC